MLYAVLLGLQRRLHRSAAAVAKDDEERRMQVRTGVLQATPDFRREDIAGHAHDEQLAEAGVKNQFRGNRESLQPRIVA